MGHGRRQPSATHGAVMTGHDPATLDQIMTAEKYRRRCNGYPAEGILVGRADLRAVLATIAAVILGPGGVISWRVNGRGFTAEPVLDQPAE